MIIMMVDDGNVGVVDIDVLFEYMDEEEKKGNKVCYMGNDDEEEDDIRLYVFGDVRFLVVNEEVE